MFCFWRSNCSWSFLNLPEMTSLFLIEWHPIRMAPIGSPDSFNVPYVLSTWLPKVQEPRWHIWRGCARTLDSKKRRYLQKAWQRVEQKGGSTTNFRRFIFQDAFTTSAFFSRSLIKNIHICRTSPSSSSSFYDLKLRYECRKELLSIDSVGLFFFAEARTLEAEAEARDSLSGFLVKQKPLPSMYGILTYIYHKIQPNVGIYAIHGWYGKILVFFLLVVQWLEIWWANQNGVCQNCQGYSFFGIFAESMGQRAPQIICSRRQWSCRR